MDSCCTQNNERAQWWGRLISAAGIKYDPLHFQGLADMPLPTTGAHLMQFVCAMGWLRTSLPEFTTLIHPLSTFLTAAHTAAGGTRTKNAVARITINDLGWLATEVACFDACKQALIYATCLAHRDETCRLCVYTDASERHWPSIITQVPHAYLELPQADQNHAPLAFMSGSFVGAPFRWIIADKEGFAIMQTCQRLDYLLRCPAGFSIFSDHRNLMYIFDPRGHNPGLAQHSEARLLR
jgi:RNase H-like domain found in reverse transcriptase